MPQRQIIVNRSARHLELYEGDQVIERFPIAVGKPSTPTPAGDYTVISKVINPGGVFGTRWLGLSILTYGIHGTNNPASIGQAVSKGCIRMHNPHVNILYDLLSVGTPVVIQ